MAIVQISKIQQRSGNIVDLPQLDNAEIGWASDARRLFVGNDNNITGVENVEVLTSYSTIDFDQINGSAGNLDVNGLTLGNGQVLTYDGNNWTNRGGNVGGLINLGEVSNVKIDGGAIGYVLETDGTGNLSWTPKSTIVAFMQNSTQANPCVITTTEDNFFVDKQQITITGVPGMTQLNGGSYYANVLTSTTFSLYTDFNLTSPVNSSAYGAFPYTTATASLSTSDQVTVGNATPFTLNDPVIFVGNTDPSNSSIIEGQTYYVKTKDTSAPNTWITLSDTVGGNTVQVGNASFTANVYTSGGRIIASVGGSGAIAASGSNTTIQFNNNNIIDGDSDFTWNFASPKVLTVNGNANVSNLNATTSVIASRFTSNVAVGTAPLTVTSTTRVANLNVTYANVSDFEVVTAQTTGTFYPVFVNGNSTANYALGANSNISFNAATGNLSTTILNANGNANVGNLGTGGLVVATGNITGGNLNTGGLVSATGNVTGGNLNTAGVLSVTGNANVGNLGTAGLIIATGNITGGNLITGGLANITGNLTAANINTAGNVTASRLISNIATGTAPITVTSTTRVANLNVAYSNVSDFINVTTSTTGTFYPVLANALTGNVAETANANLSFNAATGALSATLLTGTLTTAAQPNITSLGTLTSLSVSGNITGANVVGSLANGTSSVTIPAANGNVNVSVNGNANILVTTGTGVNVSGTLNSTGNANVGNLGTAGLITATGNVSGGNLTTAGVVSATGNVSGGNLTTAGALSVTGNANVGNIGATNGVFTSVAGTLTTAAQPNITSVGTLTSVIVSGTANLNTALTTILTTGSNTTAGTITGNWSLSAGSLLAASSANTATTAGTVTTNAQPNITSVGTLTSLGVNGTVTAVAFTANTGVFTGNGSGLSAIAGGNVTGQVGNALLAGTVYTNAQPNITSVSTSFTNLTFANAQSISGNNMTLTTGANTNVGTLTGNWSLSAGSRLQATYADLAEYYSADALYEPGVVLEFGGNQEVTLGTDGSSKVAGVVSTNPAYAMNAQCPGEFPVAIALQGRVPVKVRGTIRKGDMLVSGGNGFARPSSAPLMGTVIGKSLENFSGTEGIIEIAVGRL